MRSIPSVVTHQFVTFTYYLQCCYLAGITIFLEFCVMSLANVRGVKMLYLFIILHKGKLFLHIKNSIGAIKLGSNKPAAHVRKYSRH